MQPAIRGLLQKHAYVHAALIEETANGVAILDRLRGQFPQMIGVRPKGGKVARMAAMAPEWQVGSWLIDRTAAWAPAFVEQFITFPGRHDDMVGAATQASAYLAEIEQTHFTLRITDAYTGEPSDLSDFGLPGWQWR